MTPLPTTTEIMRRLDEVVVRLDRLGTQLDEGYVRKDVAEARDAATGIQLKGVEDELHVIGKRFDAMVAQRDRERDDRDKQRAGDRRLIATLAITALFGPVLVALLLHALNAK